MPEPTKTIPPQISPAIDISYLLATPIITTEAQNIVAAAACNNPSLLEPDDFTLTSCPTAPQTTPSQSPEATFNVYRLQVVTGLVRAKAAPLISQWPKLQLTTLAQLVNNDAKGVVQLSEMLDQLIPAMAAQKQLNEMALLVFAKTWMILYAFGAAHKTWVASGHAPILPDNQIDDFVQASLKRLASGKIGIGLMSTKEANFAAAAYDSNSNLILYSSEFFRNPLLEVSVDELSFSTIVPHEFWHSQQDAMQAKDRFGEGEVAAEILGMQAYTLRKDSIATRAMITRSSEESIRHNSTSFQLALQRMTPNKLLAEFILNPESELYRAYYLFRLKLADAAEKEMLDGRIDQNSRTQLAHDYVASRTIQLMFMISESFLSDSQGIAELSKGITRDVIAASVMRQTHNYGERINIEASVDTQFEIYAGLREFAILYDPQNEAPARDYLQNIFIPKLLGPITETYMKLIIPMNGIPE